MVRLAHALRDDSYEVPAEPLDPVAAADEARQLAVSTALGTAAGVAYDAWMATLADDKGPAAITAEPADEVQRFSAAQVSWRGGTNAVDNPTVRVERLVDGEWQPYADQSGEVVTTLKLPENGGVAVTSLLGQYEWIWTATFEAFDGFPARFGQTPNGEYRFVIDGRIRQGGASEPYSLTSEPFVVTPWEGIAVTELRREADGRASFKAVSDYPAPAEKLSTAIPFLRDDQGAKFCRTCSFRPWATTGTVAAAAVTVERVGGATQVVPAQLDQATGRWVTVRPLGLGPLDRFYVDRGAVVDTWGEINGERVAPSA
jgi:hypothetical protein